MGSGQATPNYGTVGFGEVMMAVEAHGIVLVAGKSISAGYMQLTSYVASYTYVYISVAG